ncbi:hypothetical protein INR49_030141, partial [Caranx melampygus]
PLGLCLNPDLPSFCPSWTDFTLQASLLLWYLYNFLASSHVSPGSSRHRLSTHIDTPEGEGDVKSIVPDGAAEQDGVLEDDGQPRPEGLQRQFGDHRLQRGIVSDAQVLDLDLSLSGPALRDLRHG